MLNMKKKIKQWGSYSLELPGTRGDDSLVTELEHMRIAGEGGEIITIITTSSSCMLWNKAVSEGTPF